MAWEQAGMFPGKEKVLYYFSLSGVKLQPWTGFGVVHMVPKATALKAFAEAEEP